MGYSGDKKRAYQLAWVKKRRDEWIAQNGPCGMCGGSNNLEVDHKERRSIAGGLAPASIWSRRKEIRDQELARCWVLCAECHRKKTDSELRTNSHGRTMYRNGCRCDICRQSQRDAMRRLRGSKLQSTSTHPRT